MTAPIWLRAALAALMIAVAVGSVIRLGLARRRGLRPDLAADGLHAAMGVAMAGMLLPRLSVLPTAVWAAGFGAGVLWFGAQTILNSRAPKSPLRRPTRTLGSHAPLAHFVECVAMVFMLLPVAGPMPGSALAGPVAVLALLLALCMIGYAVWTADVLIRGPGPALAVGRRGTRFAAGGSIAMSAAMWYMLIQMI